MNSLFEDMYRARHTEVHRAVLPATMSSSPCLQLSQSYSNTVFWSLFRGIIK